MVSRTALLLSREGTDGFSVIFSIILFPVTFSPATFTAVILLPLFPFKTSVPLMTDPFEAVTVDSAGDTLGFSKSSALAKRLLVPPPGGFNTLEKIEKKKIFLFLMMLMIKT